MRAMRQVRAEKPKWWLAVVSGAALRTLGLVSSRSAAFLDFLGKGQLPPGRVGLTAFQEALVIDGTPLRAYKSSLHLY